MASRAKHDWPMVRLGDVCHLKYGKALKKEERVAGEFPVFGSAGSVGSHVEANFVGPVSVVGRKGSAGFVEWSSGNCWIIDTAFGVFPKSEEQVDSRWLYWLLKDLRLGRLQKHAAVPGISKADVVEEKLLLPPLDEQRRIAAILDEVDEALFRVNQSLGDLLQLKQELFTDLFLRIERESTIIGEYLESTQYGTSDKANENVGIPILRMGNVSYNGEIDLSDLKYVELDASDREKYSLKAGDLLFNRTNSKDLVGKTAVVPELQEEYTYAGYLIRCRVNDKAVPEYISGFLNSVLGKKILRNTAKAIVGMANINANELKRLPIPQASLDEQQEFASLTSRIDDVESQMKRQRKLLQELQESLSTRAFQGEL